jgi:hypothetical protein
MLRLHLAIVLLFVAPLGAQIPVIGSDDRLDIATWNIEWFGDTKNGPSNEELQLENVAKLINTLHLDLIGLQEISDATQWNKLLQKCSTYQGVISTWSQTQKTGLMYKTEAFDFLYQKHILPNYDYDFASGRLPLEVGLMPKHPAWSPKDTLRIWVLHMKANTGTNTQKIQAYNRRYNAALALKLYVDGLPKGHKGFIMGDWNDDFDQSILSGYSTPFPSWVKDTHYVVTTYPLSVYREKSTVSYSEMIDHIACTPGMKSQWVSDSSMVLYADRWISNYGNNTSDHYPVYSKFLWNAPQNNIAIRPIFKDVRWRYQNGELIFSWEADVTMQEFKTLDIYDLQGRLLKHQNIPVVSGLDIGVWYLYHGMFNGIDDMRGMFSIQSDGTVSYR